MTSSQIQILVAMVLYMAIVIGIGVIYAKRANKNSENYFLGGRSLGPWVTAMSAEASDMSGWLLMGLPGVAYWCGIADSAWTAIGLAIGTYLNWLFVSKRLRRYSIRANNSITLPEFFSNRFRENKKIILTVSALFILIFFTVYASSCFVTCAKLFNELFELDYHAMMILGALFVLVYTVLGGFLAESASDFMQAIVMICALVIVVVLGIFKAGGWNEVVNNARDIPGFFDFFGVATPVLDDQGRQIAIDGVPLFGESVTYGITKVASGLAWGLGYFGIPQVLLRFMAIRSEKELKPSRRIAMIWVVISLAVAVFIGVLGRQILPTMYNTESEVENIFIGLSQYLIPVPFIAGIIMAGILAATISSSDSYLLIAASAFSKNIFQGLIKKNATDKQVMWVTRITLLAITITGIALVWDENSIIFKIVSFAWAGFGATFGPLMLFSLFWKRITRWGAIAGMVSGGVMVFVWEYLITPLAAKTGFAPFAVYELLPAFIISSICIVVVSLLTPRPSKEIEEDFEAVKNGLVEEIVAE